MVMAIRIPWDKYEVSLLIEAFWRVKNQEEPRPLVLEELSKKLRQYALNNGVKIDEEYRNYNEMNLQLEAMDLLFIPKEGVLLHSALLFKTMVDLYNNEYEQFVKVLEEANKRVNTVSNSSELSIKAAFTDWIKNNIDSKKTPFGGIVICYEDTSSYAMKHSISKKSFWDITDAREFNSIRVKLSQNRIFKLSHPRTFAFFEKTGKYYSVFLKERGLVAQAIASKPTVLHTSEIVLTTQAKVAGTDSQVVNNMVDFENDTADYSFTKPNYIQFCGLRENIRHWSEAYVFAINCLLAQCPDTAKQYIEEQVSNAEIRPLFATKENELVSPKKLKCNFYVETNFNATNIVKLIQQAYENCGISPKKNLIIKFTKRDTISSSKKKGRTVSSDQTDKSITSFYDWLLNVAKMGVSTCRSYSSSINVIGEWAITQRLTPLSLSSASDTGTIIEIIDSILNSVEFKDYNSFQHNRFSAALAKYLHFVKTTMFEPIPAFKVENLYNLESYSSILERHYNYGFLVDSPIELLRFKRFFEEDNKKTCELSDENLITVVKYLGFVFDGKVYIITPETKERIKMVLEHEIETGNIILYYDCLFEVNGSWLFEGHILSAEMLKRVIQSIFSSFQYRQSYFVLVPDKGTEMMYLQSDILRVWGDNSLQSINDLSHKLIYVPIEKIKYALAQDERFVWNSQEVYTHIGAFRIAKDEIEQLLSFAKQKCLVDGTTLLSELPLSNVIANNPELSETALYNAIYVIVFKMHFYKNRRALSLKEDNNTIHQTMNYYCKQREICTLNELLDLWTAKTGTSGRSFPIAVGNENMVRIDENTFVSDNKLTFDVYNIDAVLLTIVKGDFIGMKEVLTFVALPYCGFTWNLFLLESYCRRFSKLFRYDALAANSKNAGAIIKKSCKMSYAEIMTYAVAFSSVRLEKVSALNYLNDAGYISKHSYSSIDELLEKAANLRKRRH